VTITNTVDKMGILGLTNPWIIASYLGCFITVIICCIIGIKAQDLSKDDEESEE